MTARILLCALLTLCTLASLATIGLADGALPGGDPPPPPDDGDGGGGGMLPPGTQIDMPETASVPIWTTLLLIVEVVAR